MRVLVVGGGEVGSYLAKSLANKGNDVIVVDKDRERCEKISSEADVLALNRDATDPTLYEDVDLRAVDVVVAATDRDEVNLFIATIARDFGVPRIIVRVKNESLARVLERIGIEYVIAEPLVTAKLIENIIEGKYHAVFLLPLFAGNYVIVSATITEADSSVGKRLDEIPLPKTGVKVLAVFDGEKFLDPEEAGELRRNHQVIALVRRDLVEEFLEALR